MISGASPIGPSIMGARWPIMPGIGGGMPGPITPGPIIIGIGPAGTIIGGGMGAPAPTIIIGAPIGGAGASIGGPPPP